MESLRHHALNLRPRDCTCPHAYSGLGNEAGEDEKSEHYHGRQSHGNENEGNTANHHRITEARGVGDDLNDRADADDDQRHCEAHSVIRLSRAH